MADFKDKRAVVAGGANFNAQLFLAEDLKQWVGFGSGVLGFVDIEDAIRHVKAPATRQRPDLVVIIDDPVSESRQQEANELAVLARSHEIPVLIFSDRTAIGSIDPADKGLKISRPMNKSIPDCLKTDVVKLMQASEAQRPAPEERKIAPPAADC